MMRITALATMAGMASAASFCSEADAVYKDGDDTSGELIVCGSSTSTNCIAESGGNKDAFCSIVNATKGPFANTIVAACCTSTDGPAYDVAQEDTCKKCVEGNIPGAVAANVWDGENCFNNEGNNYFPVVPTASLEYVYGIVSDEADCPKDIFRLGFTGTCWRRCGSRGWGVNPSTAYMGMTGYGYGGYGYGGYGYGGYGYGGYGYGGYGYGGYGYSGFSGAYGQYGGYAYGYGMVPSAFGYPCPDPKMLEMFPDAPTMAMPYMGAGGWGMPGYGYGGYGYGGYGYGGYGYGGYGYGGYGYSPYSVYGRQAYGASYLGSVYGPVGGVGYGTVGGVSYAGSVYARPVGTTSVYGGSVYGGSVYGTPAAAVSNANQQRPHRCTPTIQCSCDTKCSKRGDCCRDVHQSGCNTDEV